MTNRSINDCVQMAGRRDRGMRGMPNPPPSPPSPTMEMFMANQTELLQRIVENQQTQL